MHQKTQPLMRMSNQEKFPNYFKFWFGTSFLTFIWNQNVNIEHVRELRATIEKHEGVEHHMYAHIFNDIYRTIFLVTDVDTYKKV